MANSTRSSLKSMMDRLRFALHRGYAVRLPREAVGQDIIDWLNENVAGGWRIKPVMVGGFFRWFLEVRQHYRWLRTHTRNRSVRSLVREAVERSVLVSPSDIQFRYETDLVLFKLRWSDEIAERLEPRWKRYFASNNSVTLTSVI